MNPFEGLGVFFGILTIAGSIACLFIPIAILRIWHWTYINALWTKEFVTQLNKLNEKYEKK